MTAEHIYGFIHIVARFLLERLLWRDSEAEYCIRRGEWQLKKTYLEGMEWELKKTYLDKKELDSKQIGGHRRQVTNPFAEDIKKGIDKALSEVEGKFWAKSDIGLGEIRRIAKTE